LSRCRTLEGIVLKSKITPEVIYSDRRVSKFQDETHANSKIEEILNAEKYDYNIQKIISKLECSWIAPTIDVWFQNAKQAKLTDKDKVVFLHQTLRPEADNYRKVFEKFRRVIQQMTHSFIEG